MHIANGVQKSQNSVQIRLVVAEYPCLQTTLHAPCLNISAYYQFETDVAHWSFK